MSNQTFTRKPSQQCQLTWTNICFHLYSTYRHTPCTTAANACQKQPWCLFQQRCGITADSSTREQKVAWWHLGDQNFIENYYKSQYFFVECINVRLYNQLAKSVVRTQTQSLSSQLCMNITWHNDDLFAEDCTVRPRRDPCLLFNLWYSVSKLKDAPGEASMHNLGITLLDTAV